MNEEEKQKERKRLEQELSKAEERLKRIDQRLEQAKLKLEDDLAAFQEVDEQFHYAEQAYQDAKRDAQLFYNRAKLYRGDPIEAASVRALAVDGERCTISEAIAEFERADQEMPLLKSLVKRKGDSEGDARKDLK